MENKFQSPNENLSKDEEGIRDIKTQLKNLGILVGDIHGKLLDIGAGEGSLVKYLKSNTDAEVIGLDPYKKEDMEDLVQGEVKNLPFKDETFDTILSHASIPNVFISMYSPDYSEESKKEIENMIIKSFSEIMRVLKKGGKAYLAPIKISDRYESERALHEGIIAGINHLQSQNFDTEFTKIETYTDPDTKESCDFYRLSIKKDTFPKEV